jgi:PadR family transcriptional regulator, regulatory protein PadR
MSQDPYVEFCIVRGVGISNKATAKVLIAFLEHPTHDQYGFGLMKRTGVKSGSLYPILDRLERAGWAESRKEDIDEKVAGRPQRTLYRMTALGQTEARHAVADFYRDLEPAPGWLPRTEPA